MINEIAVEAVKAVTARIVAAGSDEHVLSPVTFKVDDSIFEHHLREMAAWSSQIAMRDSNKPLDLDGLYVELGVEETALTSSATAGRAEAVPLTTAIETTTKILLQGAPGAGKTTAVRRIVQRLLTTPADDFLSDVDFPILIRCREVNSDLYDSILASLGVTVMFNLPKEWDDQQKHAFRAAHRDQIVTNILNDRCALVLIDGMDELSEESLREWLKQLSKLLDVVTDSRFLITARTGALTVAINASKLWLSPLNDSQIQQLSRNLLRRPEEINDFFAAALGSPYRDSLNRPLTLTHLCLLYNAYGELPTPPVNVYQRIVHLYLVEWDRERDLRRLSAYARFGPERKRQFLGAIAYELFHSGGRYTIEVGRLQTAYSKIHASYGLPADQADQVVAEIESHSGLLLRSGHSSYEFCHLSIQEFLIADYIVRYPTILGDFHRWHRVPDACAIASALSSEPEEFLFQLAATTSLALEHNSDSSGSHVRFFWLRFLERIKNEKPGFVGGIPVAATTIYLDALCWRKTTEGYAPKDFREKIRGAIEPLLQLGSVRSLLQDLIKMHRQPHDTDGTVEGPVVKVDARSLLEGRVTALSRMVVFGHDLLQPTPN